MSRQPKCWIFQVNFTAKLWQLHNQLELRLVWKKFLFIWFWVLQSSLMRWLGSRLNIMFEKSVILILDWHSSINVIWPDIIVSPILIIDEVGQQNVCNKSHLNKKETYKMSTLQHFINWYFGSKSTKQSMRGFCMCCKNNSAYSTDKTMSRLPKPL